MKNALVALCVVAALAVVFLGFIKPLCASFAAPLTAIGIEATHAGEDSAGRVR